MFYQYYHFGTSEYFCKVRVSDRGFPLHLHRSFEFIVALSGSLILNIGKQKYVLNANEAVMIFPDQPHSLEENPNEHIALIFSPDIVRAYYSSLDGALPVNPLFSVPPALLEQIKLLENDSPIIRKKAILYALCDILDETTQYAKKDPGSTDLLEKIFDFLENNYNIDCSLTKISRVLGYNSSYISRHFKEFTGITYIYFANHYKISKACYLLTNTDKTILECSLDCGYTSLRNFNRNFKSHIGTTPKEYRESQKKSSI